MTQGLIGKLKIDARHKHKLSSSSPKELRITSQPHEQSPKLNDEAIEYFARVLLFLTMSSPHGHNIKMELKVFPSPAFGGTVKFSDFENKLLENTNES